MTKASIGRSSKPIGFDGAQLLADQAVAGAEVEHAQVARGGVVLAEGVVQQLHDHLRRGARESISEQLLVEPGDLVDVRVVLAAQLAPGTIDLDLEALSVLIHLSLGGETDRKKALVGRPTACS
ncbi:MAG: hypothetical protein ABI950_09145 [Solirubrobacteraceae bacterium]